MHDIVSVVHNIGRIIDPTTTSRKSTTSFLLCTINRPYSYFPEMHDIVSVVHNAGQCDPTTTSLKCARVRECFAYILGLWLRGQRLLLKESVLTFEMKLT